MPVCALCGRDVPALTEHHLKPRSKGRRGEVLPTAMICSACHRQLHALFTNDELAREYDSVEKLRAEPRMARFLRWVRTQDGRTHVRVRR